MPTKKKKIGFGSLKGNATGQNFSRATPDKKSRMRTQEGEFSEDPEQLKSRKKKKL